MKNEESAELSSATMGQEELVSLSNKLTVTEAVQFKDDIEAICKRTSPPAPSKIILNFEATEFIDSSGIGSLAAVMKITKANGVNLVVSGLSDQIEAVLTMTGIINSLTIERCPSIKSIDHKDIEQHLPETHASVKSIFKRVVDIVGSITGLLITAVLFIPITIAIKRESKGPILFSQTRVGWMGKPFVIWKFRTMVTNAEDLKHTVENDAEGAIFKAKDDPRITKVGHFLRRTSLDELPQFWNVLMGSMSLVGTRPPTADELDQYDVPQWSRLDVKPGITGEWQVNGRSTVKSFEDIIKLDLKYQEKWNHWYDIQLIFKTVAVIFSKDSGAM